MTHNLTYIYGLVDPRNNQLRYIGKSDNPRARFAKHIREAKKSTELHRLAWIKGLLNNNLKPELLLLMQVPSHQWQQVEKLLIASLVNNPIHNLTNMADGGLGGSTARGKKRSKQARKNISNGLVELYSDNDELKNTIRQKTKELWGDEEFRKKRIALMNTPEAKTKRSKAQKQRWDNQVIRDRQSQIGKRNWQNPELNKIMREKIREKWQDPEYRKKQSESRKKAWARRKADQ